MRCALTPVPPPVAATIAAFDEFACLTLQRPVA